MQINQIMLIMVCIGKNKTKLFKQQNLTAYIWPNISYHKISFMKETECSVSFFRLPWETPGITKANPQLA